jgi:hypothetical protein
MLMYREELTRVISELTLIIRRNAEQELGHHLVGRQLQSSAWSNDSGVITGYVLRVDHGNRDSDNLECILGLSMSTSEIELDADVAWSHGSIVERVHDERFGPGITIWKLLHECTIVASKLEEAYIRQCKALSAPT